MNEQEQTFTDLSEEDLKTIKEAQMIIDDHAKMDSVKKWAKRIGIGIGVVAVGALVVKALNDQPEIIEVIESKVD
jgi:hypothetical protein